MEEKHQLETVFRECIPLLIALGDETRLMIVQRLYEVTAKKEARSVPGLNVKEITEQTRLSRPAVSHHLKILKEAGYISVHQKGVCNYYYLTSQKCIEKLLRLGLILQGTPIE